MSKPSVFVGSSTEGLAVAKKLQIHLAACAEVTIWSQGVFGLLSGGTLETLVDVATKYDFAVLVLTPDDTALIRGVEHNTPRDNVLFELGLFMGSLGRNRTFILACDARDFKLPSDLAGVTAAMYPADRSDGNLLAALGPAATQIGDQISLLGRRNPEQFSCKLRNSEIRVIKGDITNYVSNSNTILFPANVYLDTTFEGGIVDPRSTLGKRIALLGNSEQLARFDKDLDDEISRCDLSVAQSQVSLEKPGRQVPYEPGSLVHMETEQGPIVLLSLTYLSRSGGRYIASLSEESLALALRKAWQNLAAGPVRGDLYMPLVGSGFGGITRPTALTHLLLSFRSAEAEARTRLCDSLNVIVYHVDWGDGTWVRSLFQGLMA